jgi:hypothetical protein
MCQVLEGEEFEYRLYLALVGQTASCVEGASGILTHVGS